MSQIGFSQNDIAAFAGAGHWNDPDMLEIGNGGMSASEYKTHMSLWAILAAPLLAGNDLQHMAPGILEILTNRDVIAIDQDATGKQGMRAAKSGDSEVWIKALGGGAKAVALFNRSATDVTVSLKWADIGFAETPQQARDLWLHKEIVLDGPEYSAVIPAHGVVLLRVSNIPQAAR